MLLVTEISGTVRVKETKEEKEVYVISEMMVKNVVTIYHYGSRLRVSDGDIIEAGDEITEGSVNPHDIIKYQRC